MLDLNELRVFIRIADLGSISSAARAFGMPKSSASRSLARLEETLGVVLIERSTRKMRLTDAGILLKRHGQRILDDVGEAENAINGLIGVPSGDLTISAPFTFAAGPLAPMLPEFVTRYPKVKIVLSVDNRPINLLAEEIDIAIRIGPLADSELIARRLASFELWPCASPHYLAQYGEPLGPANLASHKLIAHSTKTNIWTFVNSAGHATNVAFEPVAIIPEPAVLSTMLLGGVGIGLLPDFQAQADIKAGNLIRILPDYTCGRVEAHALYPGHRSLSPKVRVFIDSLVSYLKS